MFSTVNICSGQAYGAPVVGSYASTDAALKNLVHFHSGARRTAWRFDLCTNTRTWAGSDGGPQYKGDLTPYVSRATISFDAGRAVQRTMDLTMVETTASQTITVAGGVITSAGIDYLNDVVRPVCLLGVPGTNNWVHVPLGVFRWSRPGTTAPGYALLRTATMPDMTSLVQDVSALDPTNVQSVPLTLPAGSKVIDAVRVLLTNAQSNVQTAGNLFTIPGCALGDLLPSNAFSPGALPQNTPGDWPSNLSAPGTATFATDYQINEGENYLAVINHLLKTINCYPLYADERGILRTNPLPTSAQVTGMGTVLVPDFTSAPISWTYDTTSDSIVTFGLQENIMVDDIANVVQVRVEDGVRTSYLATAQNEDPGSPYNVNNWAGSGLQRRIAKVIDEGAIPAISASVGSGTSDGNNYALMYAARELLLASWLTDEAQIPIAVNPLHAGGSPNDVITLNIYQQIVEAGSATSIPVITGAYSGVAGGDPGLISSERFLVSGWTITVALPTPGSGSAITGNAGLTTDLEPRETKTGHTMTLKAYRLTHTLAPSGITFVGGT